MCSRIKVFKFNILVHPEFCRYAGDVKRMLKSFKNLEQGILFSGAVRRAVSLMRAKEDMDDDDMDEDGGQDAPATIKNRSFRDVHGRMGDNAFRPYPKGAKKIDLGRKLTESANANSFFPVQCKVRNHPREGFVAVQEKHKLLLKLTDSTMDSLETLFYSTHAGYCPTSQRYSNYRDNQMKLKKDYKRLSEWLLTNAPKQPTAKDRIFLAGFNKVITSLKRARVNGVLYRIADSDTKHTQSCGVRFNQGADEPTSYGRILKMMTWKVFDDDSCDLTLNVVGVEWVSQTSDHQIDATKVIHGSVSYQTKSNLLFRMQLVETIEPFSILYVRRETAKDKKRSYDILSLPRGWKTEYNRN